MTIRLSDHFGYRRLLRFTLPSIAMMIFTSIYGVVDGLFVSNFVGKTPFAAVNLIMPFLMVLGALGFMFGSGGCALIARMLGEGRREKANQTGGHKATSYAMVAAIALLVIIGGAGIAQGRISLSGIEQAISAMSHKAGAQNDPAEVLVGSEIRETTESVQTQDGTQSWTETLNLVPIEELPAGDIKKVEPTQQHETQQQETQSSQSEQEEQQTSAKAAEDQKYYVVQEGDTLTGICKELYGSTDSVSELVKLNDMEDSDDIRVGQKLLLP